MKPYRNLFRAISYHSAKAYGPEGRGGVQPPFPLPTPKIWATQIFGAAREYLGKASFFKDVSMSFWL